MTALAELPPARFEVPAGFCDEVRSWLAPVAPPPKLTVSQWADQYRYLSADDSVAPGPWSTDRAEYLRGVMDAVNEPGIREIVLMKCAQEGGTQAALNILGYFVHHDPCPIMWVQTTALEAKGFATRRFEPFRRDTPVVGERIGKARGAGRGVAPSTALEKSFPGGFLIFKGAKSAPGLRANPIRIVIMDDLDGFPLTTSEGDPVGLATARTKSFGSRALIVKISTPTKSSSSRIASEYAGSDQRKFYVPCGHCRTRQVLRWEQVRWGTKADGSGDPKSARYCCEACGVLWSEAERRAAVRRGAWEATAPFDGVAGFHVTGPMSAFRSLEDLVAKYLEAEDDPDLLETFMNTELGEVVAQTKVLPSADRLYERREDFPRGLVPRRAARVTIGVDVQGDRLEAEVVAWGFGMESWSVDHVVIVGNPRDSSTWRELEGLILREWEHEGHADTLTASLTGVDSGAETQAVYWWWRNLPPGVKSRVVLLKGFDRSDYAVGAHSYRDINHNGIKIKNGVRIYPVGVSYLKDEFHSWLDIPAADSPDVVHPRYCHFPMYGRQYFKQLVAEEQREKRVNGRLRFYWHQTGPNEALDMRVYARAAAAILGIDRWRAPQWKSIGAEIAEISAPNGASEPEGPTVVVPIDLPHPAAPPQPPPVPPVPPRPEAPAPPVKSVAGVRRAPIRLRARPGGPLSRW